MTGPVPACSTLYARMRPQIERDNGLQSSLIRVIPLTLCYSASQPFEVRLVFGGPCEHGCSDTDQPEHDAGDGDATVTWYVGREIIGAGLTESTGAGDVSVAPAPVSDGASCLTLALRNASGETTLLLPRREVAAFVDRMWELVPAGTELDHVDLDAELALLLLAARN